MGVQFSVKNSKHEVSCDLEEAKSIISFKVRDRLNSKNPQHYIHYKRYKHFQLPAQIKVKFKTVALFHQFLAKNAEVISIGEKDVFIDLDGDKITVPFENVNQQSKIFCETENIEQDRKKEQQNNIHIVIGGENPGRRNKNALLGEDQESKEKIRKVLKKMMKKNNPLREVDVEGLSLKELADQLSQEWRNFDKNGQTIPNMTKKKTQQASNQIAVGNFDIQKLKAELQVKTKELQKLQIKYETYKQEWNFQKFASSHRKTEQQTKNRVIQQFLSEISEYSSRMSGAISPTSSNIKVQMTSKSALFSWIDNMMRELTEYRRREDYVTVKKAMRQPKPGESHVSSGFSEFMDEGNYEHDGEKNLHNTSF